MRLTFHVQHVSLVETFENRLKIKELTKEVRLKRDFFVCVFKYQLVLHRPGITLMAGQDDSLNTLWQEKVFFLSFCVRAFLFCKLI